MILHVRLLLSSQSYSISPFKDLHEPFFQLLTAFQVPRKSILKGSLNLPPRLSDATESTASASVDVTQTMDLTEVHGRGPRKSLARRVSFAAHTHVRLFHPDSNKGEPPSSPTSEDSPAKPAAPAFITRAENDENAIPAQGSRRASLRRRSSGMYSEFGEQSMDMDLDDETAPLPQDFLPQGEMANGSTMESEEFTEDEEDGSDMEVTEAIALNIERRRSLSLGASRQSLSGRRRSSVIIPPADSENVPSLQMEDLPEEGESFAEDMTMSSAHTGSSFVSEGSSGEPMEYTIPVLQSMRQPQEPDPLWLQLRAVTHAGSEPYEPPPPESDDDALLIQPSPGRDVDEHDRNIGVDEDDDGERDMDLTSAMSRLQKARASFGIPPEIPAPAALEDSFSDDQVQEYQDGTFSTDDSFADNSMDLDNRTINFTQRTSLGTLESSMDETDVHSGVVNLPVTGESTTAPALTASTSHDSLRNSVFSAPGHSLSSSVFSAPNPAGPSTNPLAMSVSGAANPSLSSSVFSPPAANEPPPSVFSAPVPSAAPSSVSEGHLRSPGKPPMQATIPQPFTFSLPRAGSPSKTPARSQTPTQTQPHRGTAAFAPPVPKSPKRSDQGGSETPMATGRPSVGRLSPSRTAAFETPAESSQPESTANRRVSTTLRRPSGYFAQRKSLGAGALPLNPTATRAGSPEKVSGGAGLARPRASVGAQPSGAGLGLPSQTGSNTGPVEGSQGESLYPDLSQIAEESRLSLGLSSAVPSSIDKGKGKAKETPPDESAVQSSPPPPAEPPIPSKDAPLRRPLVTSIVPPTSSRPVVDVSMVVDGEDESPQLNPPSGIGVSQAWRESVPEEPIQDDEEVKQRLLESHSPTYNILL